MINSTNLYRGEWETIKDIRKKKKLMGFVFKENLEGDLATVTGLEAFITGRPTILRKHSSAATFCWTKSQQQLNS